MSKFSVSGVRWNIFARELEAVLQAHNLRLGQLLSLGVVFNSQKISRLKRSLASPEHLTTLNPEEMERLINIMQLDDLEQKRLNAALLATAVEMTLLGRVDNHTALMAANDVFRILFDAMQAHSDLMIGVKGGSMIDEIEYIGDEAFTQALDLIDRATLTIHVSRNTASLPARIAPAHEAFETYTRALELLQQTQDPSHTHEDWLYWYDEAQRGCEAARILWQSEGE